MPGSAKRAERTAADDEMRSLGLSEEERGQLAAALDGPEAACASGSYVEVLVAHPIPMADFLLDEEGARLKAREWK